MSNILVIVEHSQGTLRKASLPGLTFAQRLAQKTGGAVHALVMGAGA